MQESLLPEYSFDNHNNNNNPSNVLYLCSSMSNGTIADWDNEYARLARISSQLRTFGTKTTTTTSSQNKQQQNQRIGDDNNTNEKIRTLQQGLIHLDTQLNHLTLQQSETQRRKRLIQHLQQQTTTSNNNNSNWSTMNMNEASGYSGGPQQHQQQSQMSIALRQQDDMIDELAIGVGRLKNQTIAIGDEARLHINLIHDMDTNLDIAQNSLEEQTRRATQLRQEQSLWKLQLIVAGLFVLLILLIFLGLTP